MYIVYIHTIEDKYKRTRREKENLSQDIIFSSGIRSSNSRQRWRRRRQHQHSAVPPATVKTHHFCIEKRRTENEKEI